MSEQDVHYPFPEPTEAERQAKERQYNETLAFNLGQAQAHSNGNGMMAVRYSAELGGLAEALAKAQLKFKPIKKTVENFFYTTERKKAMYADLAAIIEATQSALAENGLVVIQFPIIKTQSKEAGVLSKMVHASGQWLENEVVLPATAKTKVFSGQGSNYTWGEKFDAQTCGIAITYSRRYSYQSLIGVAAEEDDAANSISEASGGSKEAAKAIGEKKLEDKGVVPSLFFIWHDDSQTAEITGAESLKTANRDILKKFWNPTVGALVVNAEELEGLKYELGQRNVPFSRLGAPPLAEQLKASVEKVAKSKKV